MQDRLVRATLAALFLTLAAGQAMAHTGHEAASGFGAGLAHPFGGADHLLAMVAVGLIAARDGGRALWVLPASFVATMAAGAVAAMVGLQVGLVEAGILASVLVLGGVLAFNLSLAIAAPLTALFAAFHGFAHGAEIAAGASAAGYIAGFAAGTAILHGIGILAMLALILTGLRSRGARLVGGAIAGAGVVLSAGLA